MDGILALLLRCDVPALHRVNAPIPVLAPVLLMEMQKFNDCIPGGL